MGGLATHVDPSHAPEQDLPGLSFQDSLCHLLVSSVSHPLLLSRKCQAAMVTLVLFLPLCWRGNTVQQEPDAKQGDRRAWASVPR